MIIWRSLRLFFGAASAVDGCLACAARPCQRAIMAERLKDPIIRNDLSSVGMPVMTPAAAGVHVP